jgi:hypothetical protein
MRPDLCNALLQQHPRIFKNLEGCGDAAGDLETRVGDGWYTLLDVLCTDLQYETDHEGAPQVHATQIKEKFGRLRFRLDHASDRQRAMVRLAESLSERLCETCGAPAEELSVIEHAPRCERHQPGDGDASCYQSPTTRRSQSGPLSQIWAKLRRRLLCAPDHQATMDLYAAIRDDDIEGVCNALKRHPSLRGLAMYPDGCYRPIDLARKLGNREIVAMIESHDRKIA